MTDTQTPSSLNAPVTKNMLTLFWLKAKPNQLLSKNKRMTYNYFWYYCSHAKAKKVTSHFATWKSKLSSLLVIKRHASLSSKVTAAWHSQARYKYNIWTTKYRHCDNGWHNPDQCTFIQSSKKVWWLCPWGGCTSYWVLCLEILPIWCCILYISPR